MLDFLKKLGNKQAIGDMIRGGIVAGATPNIAGGGATDVLRGMQAGMYDRDARLAQNDELLMKAQKLDQFYDKLRQDAELARMRNSTTQRGQDFTREIGGRNATTAEGRLGVSKDRLDFDKGQAGLSNSIKLVPYGMKMSPQGQITQAAPDEIAKPVQSRMDYMNKLREQSAATAGATNANADLTRKKVGAFEAGESRAQQLADAATRRADASMVSAGASKTRADASGGAGGGKIMPASAVRTLVEIESGLPKILALEETINKNENLFGPFSGHMASVPYLGASHQKVEPELRIVKQIIGKGMEGGVLRKEDEQKYNLMLPLLTDLPDVAREKIKIVYRTIKEDVDRFRQYMQESGYRVPGMAETPGGGAPATGDAIAPDQIAPGMVVIEIPGQGRFKSPQEDVGGYLQAHPGSRVIQ